MLGNQQRPERKGKNIKLTNEPQQSFAANTRCRIDVCQCECVRAVGADVPERRSSPLFTVNHPKHHQRRMMKTETGQR